MANFPDDKGFKGLKNPLEGEPVVVAEGTGRTAVRLELRPLGRDFLLLVTGGLAHVGAVSVAGADLAELVEVPGHKEGPLADECSRVVAAAAGETCSAVVGIHQDDATKEEITAIVANVRQGLQNVISLAFS